MKWRRIFHNAGWKLGSVALAVVLWFAVVGEPEVATTRTIPIFYKNLPQGLLIGSNPVDNVRVELRGPSSRLTAVALTDVAMTLDLGSVNGPGERTFTLSEEDLRLPDGVTFLRSVPSQVRLRFGRLKLKEVPVEVTIGTPLPKGMRIVTQEITPDKLRIAGPETRVDAVLAAQTDPIDLAAVTQSTTIHVNTFVSDPQVWLETSPAVAVKLVIGKE
jgi:YbbR domain-containing protein